LKEEALDRLFRELAVEEAKKMSYGRQWKECTITSDLLFSYLFIYFCSLQNIKAV